MDSFKEFKKRQLYVKATVLEEFRRVLYFYDSGVKVAVPKTRFT